MIIADWKELARMNQKKNKETNDGMDWVDITGALAGVAILLAAYCIVGFIEYGI